MLNVYGGNTLVLAGCLSSADSLWLSNPTGDNNILELYLLSNFIGLRWESSPNVFDKWRLPLSLSYSAEKSALSAWELWPPRPCVIQVLNLPFSGCAQLFLMISCLTASLFSNKVLLDWSTRILCLEESLKTVKCFSRSRFVVNKLLLIWLQNSYLSYF